jgi:hypothetical protein
MGCTSPTKSKYYRSRNSLELSSHTIQSFKEIEVKLLKLVYDDIAIRSPEFYITKENFNIFFHISVSI